MNLDRRFRDVACASDDLVCVPLHEAIEIWASRSDSLGPPGREVKFVSCWWPCDCMAPPLIVGRVAGMLITLTDLVSRSLPPGGVSSASICGWRTFPVGEGRTAGLLALVVITTRASSIVIRSSVLISVSGDANRGTQPSTSDVKSFWKSAADACSNSRTILLFDHNRRTLTASSIAWSVEISHPGLRAWGHHLPLSNH